MRKKCNNCSCTLNNRYQDEQGHLVVYLFVISFSPHFRHHCRWRAANLTNARHLWPLSSEGSLACHTYCDTWHPFIMVISEDPWHSHQCHVYKKEKNHDFSSVKNIKNVFYNFEKRKFVNQLYQLIQIESIVIDEMYSLFDPTQEIANINLMSNNKSLRVIKSTHTTHLYIIKIYIKACPWCH